MKPEGGKIKMSYTKLIEQDMQLLLETLGRCNCKLKETYSCYDMLILYSYRALSLSRGIINLYKSSDYDCICNLSRDFFEVYATLQSLTKECTERNTKCQAEKEVLYLDLRQDFAIYNQLINVTSKKHDVKQYIQRFRIWLNRIDSHQFPLTLQQEEIISILNNWFLKSNKKDDQSRYIKQVTGKSESKRIQEAMQNNPEYIKQFQKSNKDAPFIYSLLCGYSHSNFSTLQDLETKDGKFAVNTNTENIEPCLFNIHWAMQDIIQSLERIAA